MIATVRSLTTSENDISVAGSEPELESPVVLECHPIEDEVVQADQQQSEPSPALGPALAKYFEEEEEEQESVLAVGGVKAFLSVIGGFSLGNHDVSTSKVKRRRKVKREAPPPTKEEEQRAAKVEAAANVVLKKVHDQLWSRWGEATRTQQDMLQKHIRRGLRHLAEPTQADKRLVPYLCGLGRDWESLLEESQLNRSNIHEWSDKDWLKHASREAIAGAPEGANCSDTASDSGESIWEEVDEGARDDQSIAMLKHLRRIRLLRRIVTAFHSGKLVRMLAAYRAANAAKSPNRQRFSVNQGSGKRSHLGQQPRRSLQASCLADEK